MVATVRRAGPPAHRADEVPALRAQPGHPERRHDREARSREAQWPGQVPHRQLLVHDRPAGHTGELRALQLHAEPHGREPEGLVQRRRRPADLRRLPAGRPLRRVRPAHACVQEGRALVDDLRGLLGARAAEVPRRPRRCPRRLGAGAGGDPGLLRGGERAPLDSQGA